MKKGKFAATIVAVVLFATCAKPKLNGVADGVILTMNDVSSDMSLSINGGFSEEEIENCSTKTFKNEKLKLNTGSTVNIYINPQSFSLYAGKTYALDVAPDIWYKVDRVKNNIEIYKLNWKFDWVTIATLDLGSSSSDEKISLETSNPFQIARKRLGVRLGLRPDIFNSPDSSIILSKEESEAVQCASALNTHYELLTRDRYAFED